MPISAAIRSNHYVDIFQQTLFFTYDSSIHLINIYEDSPVCQPVGAGTQDPVPAPMEMLLAIDRPWGKAG